MNDPALYTVQGTDLKTKDWSLELRVDQMDKFLWLMHALMWLNATMCTYYRQLYMDVCMHCFPLVQFYLTQASLI